MIKALVNEYYKLEKKGLVPTSGWSLEKVAGVVVLSECGEVLQIIPVFDKQVLAKKTIEVPKKMEVPFHEPTTSGAKPYFICDNSKYLFGYYNSKANLTKIDSLRKDEIKNSSKINKIKKEIDKNKIKALKYFNSSKDFHLSLLKNCNDVYSKAIKSFYTNWNVEEGYENEILNNLSEEMTKYNFIFQVSDKYLHDIESIKEVWSNYLTIKSKGKEKKICLVSGEKDSVATIHGKVRGISGAHTAGASLISYNNSAYDSFGKSRGNNAPIGEKASFAYICALNYLINVKENKIMLGEDTCIYWSESVNYEICEDIFRVSICHDEDQSLKLKGIMSKIENGYPLDDNISLKDNFNIICLSPNNARLSVRFFYKNSFGEILESIYKHYNQLRIQRPKYDRIEYLSLDNLLLETVRTRSKEKVSSPLLAGSLLKAIISGNKYPERLFLDIILRIRATVDKDGDGKKTKKVEKVSANKVAIIKAYLIRNKKGIFQKEDLGMSLNENSTNVAYNLGRLFALLEHIQEKANPGINATIKDKYFNSACATPRITFPIVLKLSNFHLKKIDEGLKTYFNKQLGDIIIRIDDFPSHLKLEKQGVFILGYYHQTQKRFEKKEVKEC